MKRIAFTLLELLIVVIILGILAAVVIPRFSDASTDARLSSLQGDLGTIRRQVELYRQHHGIYPTLANFAAQMTGKTDPDGTLNASGRCGPYLQIIPINPFTDPPGNDVTNTAPATTKAWYYDGAGVFRANDGQSTNGIGHGSL